MNVQHAATFLASGESWEKYIMFKGGVLVTTLFLFFTTTTLVSFTLRETQVRNKREPVINNNMRCIVQRSGIRSMYGSWHW